MMMIIMILLLMEIIILEYSGILVMMKMMIRSNDKVEVNSQTDEDKWREITYKLL